MKYFFWEPIATRSWRTTHEDRTFILTRGESIINWKLDVLEIGSEEVASTQRFSGSLTQVERYIETFEPEEDLGRYMYEELL